MSMSPIEFRGNERWYGDGAIEWWLYALVREIDKRGEIPKALAVARRIWRNEYSIGWGNCPGAHLDEICTSHKSINFVLELTARVLETLAEEKVFRKDELLAAKVGGDVLWTGDIPVDEAMEVGRGFVELLGAQKGR
jgi:hypothetical protein